MRAECSVDKRFPSQQNDTQTLTLTTDIAVPVQRCLGSGKIPNKTAGLWRAIFVPKIGRRKNSAERNRHQQCYVAKSTFASRVQVSFHGVAHRSASLTSSSCKAPHIPFFLPFPPSPPLLALHISPCDQPLTLSSTCSKTNYGANFSPSFTTSQRTPSSQTHLSLQPIISPSPSSCAPVSTKPGTTWPQNVCGITSSISPASRPLHPLHQR